MEDELPSTIFFLYVGTDGKFKALLTADVGVWSQVLEQLSGQTPVFSKGRISRLARGLRMGLGGSLRTTYLPFCSKVHCAILRNQAQRKNCLLRDGEGR